MAVTDRPMFAPRVAPRDRQSGAVGGAGITGIYSDPSGAIMRPVRPPLFPPVVLPSAATETNFEPVTLMSGDVVLYDRNTGQVRSATGDRLPPSIEAQYSEDIRRQETTAAEETLTDLQRQDRNLRERSVAAMAAGEGARGASLAEQAGEVARQIPGAEAAIPEAQALPTVQEVRSRGLLDLEGPESISPETLDIFNELGRAAQSAVPEAPVRPTGPSDMEQGARRTPAEAARTALGLSGMEEEARGRSTATTVSDMGRDTSAGPLVTNPMEVAAGLNNPKKEVREKTAADFAKEFMDMMPKYEGTPKHLLLAQIGFAIAAGDSPNAMQNIADGLLMGSEAFIKERAAKDEFDRQLQLSAAQYGLQETGKRADEKRLMEREGRNGNFFVASEDVKIGNRTYRAGETVFVPNSVIWEQGLPAGLQSESMADAIAKNKAALQVALAEAQKDKTLSVSDFTKLNTDLNTAAETYESARSLRPLVEASLIRAADGKVTGVNSSLVEWTNKAANAVGVDLGSAYEDPEKYQKDMMKVGNRLIQEILRESGRTVSDADRERVQQMVGQIHDFYTQASTDPDILVGTLQDLLAVIDQNEQAAIDQYRTVTEQTAGLYSPSGGPLELSQRATRVFGDLGDPIDMADLFVYDEATGVWKPKVQ